MCRAARWTWSSTQPGLSAQSVKACGHLARRQAHSCLLCPRHWADTYWQQLQSLSAAAAAASSQHQQQQLAAMAR